MSEKTLKVPLICQASPAGSPRKNQVQHLVKAGIALSLAIILVGLIFFLATIPSSRAAPQAAAPLGLSQLTLTAIPAGGANSSIAPGQQVTYFMKLVNDATPSNNVRLTNTLPLTMQFVSALPAPYTQTGNVVVWAVGPMAANEQRAFTITTQLPPTQIVLHDKLTDQARATWTGGSRNATPLDHYVQNAGLAKSNTTSIIGSNNNAHQAVAGEAITITVAFTIPQDTLAYVTTPRILLEDGISLTVASGVYTFTTNQAALDPQKAGGKRFTQLQFASQTITDTDDGPVVLNYTIYAVQRQRYFLGGQTGEIPYGTSLLQQPILRWCNAPGCSVNPNSTVYYKEDETANFNLVRPDVRPTVGYGYLDSARIGQGGSSARLAITNTNQASRPAAYDMVLTATVGTGLTYQSSNGGHPMAGGLVTWTVPVSLAAGQSWSGYVTVTLPTTFVVGSQFTSTASIRHQTFLGSVPYEGIYVNIATPITMRPGLAAPTKQASPGDVKIGDTVAYTVVTKLGGGTILYTPSYTDTLPKGFHYLTGTLQVQGAAVTNIITATTAANLEKLTWNMATIDNLGGPLKIITATYKAELSGLNTAGQPVYAASSSEIQNKQAAANLAALYWPNRPAGATYQATKNVLVAQPYMRNNFTTSRIDTPYANQEIGGHFNFQVNFRNTTGSTVNAYDTSVCDTLPQGLAFDSRLAFNQGTCTIANLTSEPAPGDEGTICWVVDKVCPSVDMNIQYRTVVANTALPGLLRKNNASIADYSSQSTPLPPGVRFNRHYKDFASIALPANAQCTSGCPFTVLGLAVNKRALQSSTRPGQLITYTLAYTDVSPTYNYSNFVITDTYDAYLAFVKATPPPSSNNPSAHRLLWNVGAVPQSGGGLITLTMQVASVVPGNVTAITNTMAWDSAASPAQGDQPPLSWTVTTPLGTVNLHLRMTGPNTTHAGDTITYTMVYSNNGTMAQPVTLTMGYDAYLTYSNSNITPVPGTDNVFVDNTLPNNGSNHTLTIRLTVKAPLPYTLSELNSDVILSSTGATSVADDWSIDLNRPILDLHKEGPLVPSAVGTPMQYFIHIQNNGSYTATGLIFTDTWGAHTSYNTANDAIGWTNHGTYATYQMAQLGIGAPQTINFLVTVNEASLFYTNSVSMTTNQTTLQSDRVSVWQESLATTKSANPVPAFPGRVLTYTIYYTNTGGDALNTVITDHLPSGISYVGNTLSGAGCQNPGWQFQRTGQDAIWKCGAMQPSASGQLQVWGQVTAAENTWLANATEGYAHNIVRPIDQPLYTRVARPWLGVAKSADPHPVAPGDLITYTLVYSNYGTDPAYNVMIVDHLPTQVTFVRCDPGCSYSSGAASWSLGTVPTDTLDSVTLVVQVKAGTSGQTAVNSNYTIQSSVLSPADTATGPAVETLILDPHLSIRKAAAPRVVTALNAPITYTIVYTNDGGGALTNVVITDVLSNLTLFDSASPGCVHTGSGVGGAVTCTIGLIEQGGVRTAEIRVLNSTTSEGSQIINQAQMASDQTAPVNSNSTSVWYFSSGCVPVMSADFTSDSPKPLGQGIHFAATYGPPEANTPIIYTWDFGGSGSGSGTGSATPVYTYTSVETYTVLLTVDNACPQAAIQATHTVTVTATSYRIYLPVVLKNH